MDFYLPINGRRHASPIWITDVNPQKTGKGELKLNFWHANYNEGVQSKSYPLRVIQRTEGFILAVRLDEVSPPALVLTELTEDWLTLNFLRPFPIRSDTDLQAWCEEHFRHGEAS